jgi:hypothetical protein
MQRIPSLRVAGGGAEGDAPEHRAPALGLPIGQPQPPTCLPRNELQRIAVVFSDDSKNWRDSRHAAH